MPFTFSHPAIVLPLIKVNPNYLSATAVIFGSMAPDFEYFLRMELYQEHGHTFWGMFYFNLPLVILLTTIYHLWVRETFIEHLPISIKRRFLPYAQINWVNWVKKRWWVLIYSALIGIFAHLFWDAFTHQSGIFVKHLSILQGKINILGVTLFKTEILQLLSTVVGAAIILLYLLIQPGQIRSWLNTHVLKYWTGVAIVTFLVLLLRFPNSLSQFIATSIAGFLTGIILISILTKKYAHFLGIKTYKDRNDTGD